MMLFKKKQPTFQNPCKCGNEEVWITMSWQQLHIPREGDAYEKEVIELLGKICLLKAIDRFALSPMKHKIEFKDPPKIE